jgi:hypothetical protein
MRLTIVWRLLSLAVLTLALGGQGVAQGQRDLRYGGVVNDYTANFDGIGAWHIMGEWSMSVKGDSGKGTFSVGFTMARADVEPRSFHTHHITLDDGDVTALSNGYRISGTGVMTGNGSLAGFSGSPVTVEITGGNAMPYSNLSMTFAGGAVSHFGSGAIKGVVTQER